MKKRIFTDTNVIIEAFRTGCWTAICATHAIETVEKCIEESLTGDPSDPRHVAIASADLTDGLAQRHAPPGRRGSTEMTLIEDAAPQNELPGRNHQLFLGTRLAVPRPCSCDHGHKGQADADERDEGATTLYEDRLLTHGGKDNRNLGEPRLAPASRVPSLKNRGSSSTAPPATNAPSGTSLS